MEPIRIHRGLVLSLSKAFTLIELLVVLAIITIVSAVVINSQGSFNKTLILSNTAYDIALALRSAASYGLGTRAYGSAANAGYGLHFQTGTAGFLLFSDIIPGPSASGCHGLPPPPRDDASAPDAKPGNCAYDIGEKVTDYAFGNGIKIKDFCAYSTIWTCTYAHDGAAPGLTSLDIVFTRPNAIPFVGTNGTYSGETVACVAVTSPQGGTQFVSVKASGQITANATSCP